LTLKAAVLGLKDSGVECHDLKPLTIIKHTITHHRITLHCFIGNIRIKPNVETVGLKWTSKTELEKIPMPSAHQKIRSSILDINTD
jgi:adenine-specific DNA glycosylase